MGIFTAARTAKAEATLVKKLQRLSELDDAIGEVDRLAKQAGELTPVIRSDERTKLGAELSAAIKAAEKLATLYGDDRTSTCYRCRAIKKIRCSMVMLDRRYLGRYTKAFQKMADAVIEINKGEYSREQYLNLLKTMLASGMNPKVQIDGWGNIADIEGIR